jgi:ABC-type multidrug transport system ATPase subunit
VKDISYISYAWRLLLINEFGDRTLGNNCDSADSSCVHGNEFLNSLGFHQNEYSKFWCILLGSMAFYYFLAIFLLSTNTFPPYSSAVSSTSSTEEEASIETEDEKSDSSEIPHVSTLKEHRQVSKSTNRSTTYSAVTNVEDEVLYENIYETLEMDELNPRSPPNPLSRSPSTRLSIVTELKETVSTPDYVPRIKEGILLELVNVSLSAGGTSLNKVQTKPILNNINLRLEPGNLIALMGASGSGKSTLMNLLADRIPHKILDRNQNQSQSQSQSSAFFSKTGLTGSGEILFNGKAPSSSDVRNLVSYVLQFDFHMPNLTVKETLDFHVKLRFPMETPPPFLVDRLNVVMKLLGLSSCASVLVGSDEVKGISGGEKRRLSIAIQLLSDPVLCLLDEPTTGLDSFTARHIVQTLKALACLDEEDLLDFAENQNSFSPTKRLKSPLSMSFSHSFLSSQSKSIQKKTVLISIHQARYDIFENIDQIILLAKGNIIWSGDIEGMLNHFNQLGFPCPYNVNPADFIVDLTSEVITESSLDESKSILDILISGYVAANSREQTEDKGDIESNNNNTSTIIIKDASKRSLFSMNDDLLSPSGANNEIEEFSTLKPDWFTIPLLVKRNFQNLWRQKSLFFARCKHPLFLSIVLCLFFAPLTNDQASIQNRFGILYQITAMTIFFGLLMGLEIFRTDTLLFRREYVDGIYSPTAFLISYFIIAIPLILLGASIFAFSSSNLIGLAPTGNGFGHFTIISFCVIFAGECLSVFVCSTFTDLRDSANIFNFILGIFGVTMGTFAISMPIFFNYYRYYSPLYWSMYLFASFSFQGEKFSCDYHDHGGNQQQHQCFFTDGNDIFEFYFGHYDEESFLFHYWMLIVVTMSYFILAVISFRLSAWNLSH